MKLIIQTVRPVAISESEMFIANMQPLWVQSHNHHMMKSTYFKEFYEQYDYKTFKRNIMNRYETIMFFFVFDQASASCICSPIACCFVGFQNEEAPGFLGNFIVSKDYRRKKVGTALFEEVEKIISSMGKLLSIELSYGNDTAIEFYKSFGYFPKAIGLQKR